MGPALGSAKAAQADQPTVLAPASVFRGHTDCVWCVTSLGAGEGLRLVSSSDDGHVCIWGGEVSRRLRHGGRVFCVRVLEDPEGRSLVATTGTNGVLKVSR
jgi:WD40 repeat protein